MWTFSMTWCCRLLTVQGTQSLICNGWQARVHSLTEQLSIGLKDGVAHRDCSRHESGWYIDKVASGMSCERIYC